DFSVFIESQIFLIVSNSLLAEEPCLAAEESVAAELAASAAVAATAAATMLTSQSRALPLRLLSWVSWEHRN
ncbi:hypothetical protein, partial [Lactobacillus helveticus]|uniref:hypothetical protein n=1 Tax=Lactobacillus helveticus TaxID=1587 RepID=UPI001C269D51